MNQKEQPWKTAMISLIAKLKCADKKFVAAEHDLYGMQNFIQNVSHPAWKHVINESTDDVTTILNAIAA